jgi:hypothetical protein
MKTKMKCQRQDMLEVHLLVTGVSGFLNYVIVFEPWKNISSNFCAIDFIIAIGTTNFQVKFVSNIFFLIFLCLDNQPNKNPSPD